MFSKNSIVTIMESISSLDYIYVIQDYVNKSKGLELCKLSSLVYCVYCVYCVLVISFNNILCLDACLVCESQPVWFVCVVWQIFCI